MASLLEKTRKINRLLQRSENVEYDGISRVLSNVLNANVYITNKKGKIFGYAFVDAQDLCKLAHAYGRDQCESAFQDGDVRI